MAADLDVRMLGQSLAARGVATSINHGAEPEITIETALLGLRVDGPAVLVQQIGRDEAAGAYALPQARYRPRDHVTLEAAARESLGAMGGCTVGALEHLSAFSDGGGTSRPAGAPVRLAISYLALARAPVPEPASLRWRSWYDVLPWEDWRQGRPELIASAITPRLEVWAAHAAASGRAPHFLAPRERVEIAFGLAGAPWDEERALERFDLLDEAGLLEGSSSARPASTVAAGDRGFSLRSRIALAPAHGRIVAAAVGRVRAAIKDRPLLFALMADEFTLYELQRAVESILGPNLHKQNFRRLIETSGLIEPSGAVRAKTGGRPAKLFRFRRAVLWERAGLGVRIKPGIA